MSPVLAFDIETIPDVPELLRRADPPLSDAEVACARRSRTARRATSNDFLPPYLQRVARHLLRLPRKPRAARPLVRRPRRATSERRRSSSRSSTRVDTHVRNSFSWNGGGFDLPVLQPAGAAPRRRRRALLGHGRTTTATSRYNNYISRYHLRHLDLMDLMAMYQSRANAPLDAMARAARLSGQARHGRLPGVRRVPRRPAATRSAATAKPTR